MKKILVVLVILLLVVPAVAKVTVEAEADLSGNVTISYEMDGDDANLPRAFGLDVVVTGTTISGITEVNDKDYYVAPGTFEFDPCFPEDVCWGYAIVDLDTDSFTIEMGSLYDDDDPEHTTPPPSSGTLCKFTLDANCEYYVDLEENSARGGVVMEDTEKAYDANYVVLVDANGLDIACAPPAECFPNDANYATQYTAWTAYRSNGWGVEANSWCAEPNGSGYQCHGDADGVISPPPFYYRIYSGDLSVVVANWKKKLGVKPNGADPRADIDHKSSPPPQFYKVYSGDLSRVVTNWKKKNLGLSQNCPLTDAANNSY
jgi:hypothetical protein